MPGTSTISMTFEEVIIKATLLPNRSRVFIEVPLFVPSQNILHLTNRSMRMSPSKSLTLRASTLKPTRTTTKTMWNPMTTTLHSSTKARIKVREVHATTTVQTRSNTTMNMAAKSRRSALVRCRCSRAKRTWIMCLRRAASLTGGSSTATCIRLTVSCRR